LNLGIYDLVQEALREIGVDLMDLVDAERDMALKWWSRTFSVLFYG
jgi:starch phosphorylase